MSKIKRIHLFSKLSKISYQALESATILCKNRGNSYVELAHWINQLMLEENTDCSYIVDFFELDKNKITKDLILYLDKLPKGSSSIEDFSNDIELAIKEAWMISSIVFDFDKIRSGSLLLALKQNSNLISKLHDISHEFIKINADVLQDKFKEITKGSVEVNESYSNVSNATKSDPNLNNNDVLSLYTIDLTQKAKEGKIDEIVGRDKEIRQAIDILIRRRQNNPILTGEAGVGKTAIAEGLAVRLAKNEVPSILKGYVLRSLDIGLLQAGASMKGEFEERLKKVIEAVQNSSTPIILFIDEAHTLIGAGGTAGQNDAANLLKPALARGELRCLAATTWQEYIKYFEKDPALSRRFQNISVEEPDDEKCIQMMRSIAKSLEKFHHVTITNEAIIASVKLSRRYLPSRKLPDKSTSILDTASARVALSQSSMPESLEILIKKIESKQLEKEILLREEREGIDHSESLKLIDMELVKLEQEKQSLEAKFDKEKEAIQEYKELRTKLLNEQDENELEKFKEKLNDSRGKIAQIQGENPMILPVVDAQAIAAIISEWTGIPLGRMIKDETKSILALEEELAKNIIGQNHSLSLIAKSIITAKANLADPQKPQAIFMLAGPSGVGKTETALSIAQMVYGSRDNIITINMSEFQEAHTVSTLKGAPPGYVGYGEGGVLTEAVRKKPYSVILLDEIEKAHHDIHEIFFQVFDKGRMEDGAGRLVDFRNTIIILTTNVGDSEIFDLCEDGNYPKPEILERAIRPVMQKVFPAALLGRLVVVPYYPLNKEALHKIIDLKLQKIIQRIQEYYKAEFAYDVSLKDEIMTRCNNIASGARMIDAIINNEILPNISIKFLQNNLETKKISKVFLEVKNGEISYQFEYKKD